MRWSVTFDASEKLVQSLWQGFIVDVAQCTQPPLKRCREGCGARDQWTMISDNTIFNHGIKLGMSDAMNVMRGHAF